MYEKELISQQEYETQKWMLDLLKLEKKIYEAQLENLSTGAKQEEVNLIRTQIASLKKSFDILSKRKADLNITAPISGYLSVTYAQDTLITLINDKEIILYAPIKIEDLNNFSTGKNVNVILSNSDNVNNGVVVSISREAKLLNNQSVAFISIKLKNDEKILPGMFVETIINIKKISLLEYLLRLVKS